MLLVLVGCNRVEIVELKMVPLSGIRYSDACCMCVQN